MDSDIVFLFYMAMHDPTFYLILLGFVAEGISIGSMAKLVRVPVY